MEGVGGEEALRALREEQGRKAWRSSREAVKPQLGQGGRG